MASDSRIVPVSHMPAIESFTHIPTISDVIKGWSKLSPERPALVENDAICTYGQLAAIVRSTTDLLAGEGVRPGDRVMIVGDNSRSFVALLLAAADLHAWPVPVAASISTHELSNIYRHCDPRYVIYTQPGSARACDCLKQGGTIREFHGFGSIVMGSRNEHSEPEQLDPNPGERIGALLYTSGTTGIPKGVMLSNRALLFIAAGSATIRSLTPDDRLYGVLPMSHVTGLSVLLLGGLLTGTTIYLARRFDPVATLRSLDKDGLTVMLGAPGMFSLLLEYAQMKGIKSLRYPALRIISSVGAPLHANLKSAVESVFGLVLHNGYGLTECSPTIAQTRIESPRSDTSVGPAFPGVEIKLIGTDRNPVAAGEMGELWVRGPNLMKGYYRALEETAAVMNVEGWFNTRDLARMEAENIFIVSRTKDLIIHFGHNVYPGEVEAALNSHPCVLRSAVIGRKTAESAGGEEILAIVQPQPQSSITTDELAEYAAQRLTAYKRPSQIVFLADMPVTPIGKIMRHELMKMVDLVPVLHPVDKTQSIPA